MLAEKSLALTSFRHFFKDMNIYCAFYMSKSRGTPCFKMTIDTFVQNLSKLSNTFTTDRIAEDASHFVVKYHPN